MPDTSYFLHPVETVRKNAKDLRNYLNKAGCCSGISNWIKEEYYSVVKPSDLTVKPKMFIEWIRVLMGESFPIVEVKQNDFIPKDTDMFKEKSTTVTTAIHFKNPVYMDTLMAIGKRLQKGEKVYVRGTERGEALYNWTDSQLKKAEVVNVNPNNGFMDIKILEHDLDLLHGDIHDVELQAFNDYDSNIPLITEKELGKEVKKEDPTYYDCILVRVDAKGLNHNELLAVHSLIRYGWHSKYTQLIQRFFEARAAVPEATFFELLLMVSIRGNYSGYYSIFEPSHKGGFMPSSKIMNNLKNAKSDINGCVYQKLNIPDIYENAKKFLRESNPNYRKGYEALLISSYGSKNKELRCVKAKEDFGQLTGDKEYTIIDENYGSFKVTADDYSFRWYKKERFKSPKVLVDFNEPKDTPKSAESLEADAAQRQQQMMQEQARGQRPPQPQAADRQYVYGSDASDGPSMFWTTTSATTTSGDL